VLSWSKLGTRYGKVRQLKYYCNIFLSVNPIFVVICCPIKQPLQNCLSKYSFMLLFFKSTKWKHVYLLLPENPSSFRACSDNITTCLLRRLDVNSSPFLLFLSAWLTRSWLHFTRLQLYMELTT
jgi:hypothetical protein